MEIPQQKKKSLKPYSDYDSSISENHKKFEEDWDYIINGNNGNYLSRFRDVFKRDWNSSSEEELDDFKQDVTFAVIPGGFLIRGQKYLGKNASRLANKLLKYGKDGKLPSPHTDLLQFKTVEGNLVHIETGAIYRKSYTAHTGKDGEYKIYPAGTTNFNKAAKNSDNRITIDLYGKVINN